MNSHMIGKYLKCLNFKKKLISDCLWGLYKISMLYTDLIGFFFKYNGDEI